MAFPTNPNQYDTHGQYIFDTVWKERLIADEGKNIVTGGDGFIKFFNGVMIQWGRQTVPDITTITYPQSFINEPVVIADSARYSYVSSIGVSDVQPTITDFKFYDRYFSDPSVKSTDSRMFWIAIGLWKNLEVNSLDMTQDIKGSRVYDTTIGAYRKIPSLQLFDDGSGHYWMEFEDGVIIQWGKDTIAGITTISYVKNFASEPVVFVDWARANYRPTNGTNNIQPTVSDFVTYPQVLSDGSVYTGTTTLHWIALGRTR